MPDAGFELQVSSFEIRALGIRDSVDFSQMGLAHPDCATFPHTDNRSLIKIIRLPPVRNSKTAEIAQGCEVLRLQ